MAKVQLSLVILYTLKLDILSVILIEKNLREKLPKTERETGWVRTNKFTIELTNEIKFFEEDYCFDTVFKTLDLLEVCLPWYSDHI